MKKFITLFFLCLGISHAAMADTDTELWVASNPDNNQTIDHSQWQTVLDKYVRTHESGVNRVDYGAIKNDGSTELKSYVTMLQSIDPRQYNKQEQFAYWVNLYNAATVQLIVDNYPVESIREIKDGFISFGPWGIEWIKVAGVDLSLDDVEHKILRPIWQDNKIHYAVNCASFSCPNLSKTAFTAGNTDEQLATLAAEYINHPRGVQVEKGKLRLSSIYDWYNEDFETNNETLIDHLKTFANPNLKVKLASLKSTSFSHDYDWGLNDIDK